MTHDELKDALPALALDALDSAERDVVAAHVRGCDECAAELAALQRVTIGIGLEAAPVTPPESLRGKVIARAASQPPRLMAFPVPGARAPVAPSARRAWVMPAALAASVVLAASALLFAFAQRAEVQRLSQLADVLLAPDVVRVDLKGQADAAGATGRAFWSRSSGLVFSASALPALPAGRVYQLWTITGTAATSAGILTTDGRGGATLTGVVPPTAARPDAMGVTIEPTGGSATPTLPIVLMGAASQ